MLCSGSGPVAWLSTDSRAPGPLTADKIVNIVREDDGGSISAQLERAGVIKSVPVDRKGVADAILVEFERPGDARANNGKI